jgi:hypothetical protein
MTSTSESSPLLASALEVLRDTLPFIPALIGLEEATATTTDAARQTAVMLVEAIRAGVTREDQIAAVVLASLLAQDPLSLVGVVALAIDSAQRRIKLGGLTDTDGRPLPRVSVGLTNGEISYSLEGERRRD